MSDIVRDAGHIACEINFIKRQTAVTCLNSAIEIGKLLTEAKESVPYGEWGKWLEDNVDYSISTANNLMKLYSCYGEQKELKAFDENVTDIFGALTPSQALVLSALPEEKRVEYVESHDVENESVKEMKKKVDELLGKNKEQMETIKKLRSDYKACGKTSDERGEKIKALNNIIALNEKNASEAKAKIAELESQIKELSEKKPPDADEIRKQYEEELETYKKRLQRAESSELQKFSVHFEMLQNEFRLLAHMVDHWDPQDVETKDKLHGALAKTIDAFKEMM